MRHLGRFAGQARSRSMFSNSTFTRGSPRKPSWRPSVRAAMRRRTCSSGALLARATRAARAPEEQVRRLIAARTEGRQLGFLGEPRVNVLLLNMDLDRAWPAN